MSSSNNEYIGRIAENLLRTYEGDSGINFIDETNLPVRDKIVEIIDLFMEILFPGYTGRRKVTRANVESLIAQILSRLEKELHEQLEKALMHQCRMKNCRNCDCKKMAREVTAGLLEKLPDIRNMLKSDVLAAYDGDPAAKSFEEVVISYPYIFAIAIHRFAHELEHAGIPLIPRMMSELAHSRTGIDIHPGATIGKRFFIDHGTGVVIGETTVIGDNVKLYQGVTLGALSFARDERGSILKGGKRHPTIEDDVVIYAEATILGDITLGKGAVIGGNVWLRKSVPPGMVVGTPKTEIRYIKQNDEKK